MGNDRIRGEVVMDAFARSRNSFVKGLVKVDDLLDRLKLYLPKDKEYLNGNEIVEMYHVLQYCLTFSIPNLTRYRGIPIHKNPCDIFNYQEILFDQEPDFIIECGAFQGGSTLLFAQTLDLIGKGQVISIDINERKESWHPEVRQHPRAILIAGSSTDTNIVSQVKELTKNSKNNFVILDSDHKKAHVLAEMCAYSDLVHPGNFMIVEDSNLNGHPIPPSLHKETIDGGPYEAVVDFLKDRTDFIIDGYFEQRFLYFSNAHHGYLRKI